MKVLTLHQPWASLVALGVKTIETRSWSTNFRGPLAIHAGAKRPLPGAVGNWQVRPPTEETPTWALVEREVPLNEALNRGRAWYDPLPLGAIVATCTLDDVAPIGGPFSFRTGIWEGDEGDFLGRPVVVRSPAHLNRGNESLVLDHNGRVTDVTDQLPYGGFEPDAGRYAWLLADIVPVDPPVPFKGAQGLTKTWTPD